MYSVHMPMWKYLFFGYISALKKAIVSKYLDSGKSLI